MLTTLWAGLSSGAVYVLVALGFNIVFVSSGTFNFAQPQFLILGTFISYAICTVLGWPPLVALLAGALAGFVIGFLEERIAVRPISGSGVHGELVTTVGWSVIMEGAIILIWGMEAKKVPGLVPDLTYIVFGSRISLPEMLLVAIAIILPLALHSWSRWTLLGLANLATAEDRQAAMLRGINVRRLALFSFAGAGALMAALGPIVGPKTFAIATLGGVIILKGFVALSVGGFGSYTGSLVGGLAVGIVEAFATRYLSAPYGSASIFALLMLVLLVRPEGLFGKRQERMV